jgi:alpha-methylacyl-CoA racemase
VGDGGVLAGLRVVELAGVGTISMAGMVLAGLGAEVARLERPDELFPSSGTNPVLRSRRRVTADLKTAEGRALALDLAGSADVVLEALRPGAAERLGLGPGDCLARNPRLVYARITGWGQDGPLAGYGGHDINYVALTGVLRAMGHDGEAPLPPLNLLGFAGGPLFAVVGILAALREVERSGHGQVVDAAAVDGISLLAQMVWAERERGAWVDARESNYFDGGAPFHTTYACADGEYVAVGALEPPFYARLLAGLGLAGEDLPAQLDRAAWPALRARFAEAFATRPRDAWVALFDGVDACVTPVLSFDEAAAHPQIGGRGVIVRPAGLAQAAPAPRFSRTPTVPPSPSGAETGERLLARWRG